MGAVNDVQVRIERVRVPRTARASAPELARAVQRELEALLRREPVNATNNPMTLDLDATIHLPGAATPAAVARALARRAHRQLTARTTP
jgi:hypothetical protein